MGRNAAYAIAIGGATLGAFALAIFWLGMDSSRAVTVSFATLALAQLWHVFNMRDLGTRFFRNDVTRNPYAWGAVILCAGIVALAVYSPGLAQILKLRDPGLAGWALILGASAIPWALGQAVLALWRRSRGPLGAQELG